MTLGQIVVTVLVVGFLGYEVYALVRDMQFKKKAKEALRNEKDKTERV